VNWTCPPVVVLVRLLLPAATEVAVVAAGDAALLVAGTDAIVLLETGATAALLETSAAAALLETGIVETTLLEVPSTGQTVYID